MNSDFSLPSSVCLRWDPLTIGSSPLLPYPRSPLCSQPPFSQPRAARKLRGTGHAAVAVFIEAGQAGPTVSVSAVTCGPGDGVGQDGRGGGRGRGCGSRRPGSGVPTGGLCAAVQGLTVWARVAAKGRAVGTLADDAVHEPAWLAAAVGVRHRRAVLQGHLGGWQGRRGRAEAVRAKEPHREAGQVPWRMEMRRPETGPPPK